MKNLFRIQVLALLTVIVFFATYAFASSKSNTPPHGGEGANLISGWNVSNLTYVSASDPSKISGIAFDLDGPAALVKIKVEASSTSFFDCTNPIGTHWVCNVYPNISMSEMDEFRVIATGG
jgi:hypothetical protein